MVFLRCWKKTDYDDSDSDEEVPGDENPQVQGLSYVGRAVYDTLRFKHSRQHRKLWSLTEGQLDGELQFTPREAFTMEKGVDFPKVHDEWFPELIGDLIAETEEWCDVMTLAPPDGLFMKSFRKALKRLCKKKVVLQNKKITIRMMFGNVVGLPVNCSRLLRKLTKGLPADADDKIRLWVGSWRKGVSWNHAKIIAVDGRYLWTGGHNFWDKHYLRNDPTNDLAISLKGEVARAAHRYANEQWAYIVRKQSTCWGRFVDNYVPDGLDVPRRSRVTISEFPRKVASEFPPCFKAKRDVSRQSSTYVDRDTVPMITIGRYATLVRARPSDDAFVALLLSARRTIRLAVQDIGPVLLPGTRWALPGCVWPEEYLKALARVIWESDVQIEMVLSNPNSIPGNCAITEANYGNGWDCVDVAAEIIKSIQKQFPKAHHGDLRHKVERNLRVCFLRNKGGTKYNSGQTLGLHSKHFIIDDICCYIGSQNLYICDLAEWGVVIDDPEKVQILKGQYWDPMWEVSYTPVDCDVQKVMDGLKIERRAPNKLQLAKITVAQKKEQLKTSVVQKKEQIKTSVEQKKEQMKAKMESFRQHRRESLSLINPFSPRPESPNVSSAFSSRPVSTASAEKRPESVDSNVPIIHEEDSSIIDSDDSSEESSAHDQFISDNKEKVELPGKSQHRHSVEIWVQQVESDQDVLPDSDR